MQSIEMDVLAMHGGLSFRPTLEVVAKIGELLLDAKKLVPHGAWLPWLKRCGLSRQSASDYTIVFEHLGNVRHAGRMTLKQFLEAVRRRPALGNSGDVVRQSWTTPRDFFVRLNVIFEFTVDGAASGENAMLPRFLDNAESED